MTHTQLWRCAELSERTRRALSNNNGILYAEQLAELTDHDLRCLHGVGKLGLHQIRALLSNIGANRE